MSVSPVASPVSATVQVTQAAFQNQRTSDGDFRVPTAQSSKVKDAEGDHKPLADARNTSSSVVQAALSNLTATNSGSSTKGV